MVNVAVLDDYQEVALQMTDWSVLPGDVAVNVYQDHLTSEDALVSRLNSAHIIAAMRERTAFSRGLLERLPNLRLLITTGPRNASIDVKAATELGIVVSGTGGVATPTAELTWALILALLRSIPHEDREIRTGRWETTVGVGLFGKTLGVLGLGNLGSQVASVGRAFGMSVVAWSQNLTEDVASKVGAKLVTKNQLFSMSDIVTIHLRLSDRTFGLVGLPELQLMKPDAYLINTSRGPIVDEKALIHCLQSHSIAGAGLDVFDQEPIPMNHPLLRMENTVLTPHLGYVTVETYRVFFRDIVENITTFLSGNPARVLNPEVLGKTRGIG